ncbi:MAG TPA: DUF123 domain-containing protein, partial [Anaerolineae bacterium]
LVGSGGASRSVSVITEPCCTVLGREWPCGVYLLRIEVAETLTLAFGRFRHGQPITVLPGAYVYTGSAMGQRGTNSLPHRLLRHATRSGGKVPHPIRADLLTFFPRVHLSQGLLRPPGHKKLFWHIDYLLDCEPIALCHIFIVRNPSASGNGCCPVAAG